jgi:tRNA1(Val) A37 N6-methylase TrmN6
MTQNQPQQPEPIQVIYDEVRAIQVQVRVLKSKGTLRLVHRADNVIEWVGAGQIFFVN